MAFNQKGGWFESTGPIHVDGGIAVRAKRGKIGEQWWSRKFVDILEQTCDPGRLARGRTYARKGQVIGFELTPGLVAGQVQGSRPQPYRVTIAIPAFNEAQWTKAVAALGSQALHRAALLAGEIPHELAELFDGLGLPLFPSAFTMD